MCILRNDSRKDLDPLSDKGRKMSRELSRSELPSQSRQLSAASELVLFLFSPKWQTSMLGVNDCKTRPFHVRTMLCQET